MSEQNARIGVLSDEYIAKCYPSITPVCNWTRPERLLEFHHVVGIKGKSNAHNQHLIVDHMRQHLGCKILHVGDHSRMLRTSFGTLFVMQPYIVDTDEWWRELHAIECYCLAHGIWWYARMGWYHYNTLAIAVDYDAYLRSIKH